MHVTTEIVQGLFFFLYKLKFAECKAKPLECF